MNGITLWIILGVLVGAVVIFLIVASILDRKKTKKLKIKQKQEEIEKDQAESKVIVALNVIINQNTKLLSKFIPSVGKIKMFDIKNSAKKALMIIENSKDFQLLSPTKHKTTINKFNVLKTVNSNIWTKNHHVLIKKLMDQQLKLSNEKQDQYSQEFLKKIKEIYT